MIGDKDKLDELKEYWEGEYDMAQKQIASEVTIQYVNKTMNLVNQLEQETLKTMDDLQHGEYDRELFNKMAEQFQRIQTMRYMIERTKETAEAMVQQFSHE